MTDTSSSRSAVPSATYEFTAGQNHTVSHLAVVMRFVGYAHVVLGVLLGIGVVRLWRLVISASLIFGVLAVLLVVMGLYLAAAASHFQRITTTRGDDVGNLMTALDELKNVYAMQRWVFVAAAIAVSLALVATVAVG